MPGDRIPNVPRPPEGERARPAIQPKEVAAKPPLESLEAPKRPERPKVVVRGREEIRDPARPEKKPQLAPDAPKVVDQGKEGERATPSLKSIVEELHGARMKRFGDLKKRDGSVLSPAERGERDMAPLADPLVFLVSHGEPFFEAVYPALQEQGKNMQRPSIHFGIAGGRNFSVIAATRADAAVLADLNLKQVSLMRAFGDTAKKLDREKGVGNFGPEDFVKAYARHERAQEVLQDVPKGSTRRTDPRTNLTEELTDRESWLFKDQKDGRFEHIMKLFREDRIATIALNITDTQGFKELASALEKAKEHVPGLKNAQISTVFLSNVLFFLEGPGSFFQGDHTPANSTELALRNIGIIAPDNSYVVLAHPTIKELQAEPNSPFFNRKIDGPTYEQVAAITVGPPTEPNVPRDWRLLRQVTVGGRLEIIRSLLLSREPKT